MKNKALSIIITLTALATTLATAAPTVKVFILAGQSNMVGHGKVEMGRNPNYDKTEKGSKREIKGGLGCLRALATDQATANTYKHLLDADGNWVERDDVSIYTTTSGKQKGPLTVGFGAGNWFGPELGFGQVVGDAIEEPVLIIKTAWGGKSLAVDFRPPSSGPYQIPEEKLEHWRKNQGKHGIPNIEKYTADIKKAEGHSYREMMTTIKTVIANLDTEFPELKGRTPVFAGFGWHQGWNDGCDPTMVAEYETNMVHFINDVRKDLGVKDLPFVIANTGQNGLETKRAFATLCQIQLDIGDPKKHPEFKGAVASVETRGFKRSEKESPSGFGFHWNHSGESHYLVGDAMGKAMVKLLKK
jgi:alpha-galactosidase